MTMISGTFTMQQFRPWITDIGGVFDSTNLATRGRIAPIFQRRCLSYRRNQSILCLVSFATRRIASSRFLMQRFTLSNCNSSMKADSYSRTTAFSTYIGRSTTTQMENKMIMLEGCDVCPMAWCTIMGASRATTIDGRLTLAAGCVLINTEM